MPWFVLCKKGLAFNGESQGSKRRLSAGPPYFAYAAGHSVFDVRRLQQDAENWGKLGSGIIGVFWKPGTIYALIRRVCHTCDNKVTRLT